MQSEESMGNFHIIFKIIIDSQNCVIIYQNAEYCYQNIASNKGCNHLKVSLFQNYLQKCDMMNNNTGMYYHDK